MGAFDPTALDSTRDKRSELVTSAFDAAFDDGASLEGYLDCLTPSTPSREHRSLPHPDITLKERTTFR